MLHSHTSKISCPGCGSIDIKIFYEIRQVPVHSVLLLNSRSEAENYPRGDIRLGFCQGCGFIFNTAFDPGVHEYSSRYEATQGYSPTFNAFHKNLAQTLIDRFDLHGKRIIEIGCGQGEFLSLLCELGGNTGIGFDPAYVPERSPVGQNERVSFIQDFYSEKYVSTGGDFVCCKMTLEHIPQVADFVGMVRRSVEQNLQATIFFQVPNARYVFGEIAFWDIYYEHCSYFSLGSLARLFARSGFEVIDLWKDYDDQYLMIAARPVSERPQNLFALPDDMSELAQEIDHFSAQYPHRLAAWRQKIAGFTGAGKRVVLWGGGSKAVAFLTTLGITTGEIAYAIDINPHKTGSFIAGTGQEIQSPQFLLAYRPDVVIVMNPVYCTEVRQALQQMGLYPEIMVVNSH